MRTIESDTLIPVDLIADAVIHEAGPLIEHYPHAHARLCAMAEHYYAGDGVSAFGSRVRSKHGREYLTHFIRLWLAAALLEAGVCRCQLPFEWGTGGTRPLDANPNTTDK